MKWHEDWVEYEPGDIKSIAENYFAWEDCRQALDLRVDFERACKFVGCWGTFLKQGEIREWWQIYRMIAFLNGELK